MSDNIIICLTVICGFVSIYFSLRFVFNIGRLRGRRESEEYWKDRYLKEKAEIEKRNNISLRQTIREIHKELRIRKTLSEQEAFLEKIAGYVDSLIDD